MLSDFKTYLLLQKNKIKRFSKIFTQKDWVRIIVILAFVFIGLILALFTYFFSKTSFMFLKSYPEFTTSLLLYTLLTCFFLIFILTLISSLITSLKALFSQEDDILLLPLPIKPQIVFESRLIDVVMINSWPSLIFGLPLLLALKNTFKLSSFEFLLSIGAIISILLLSAFLAALIALLITYFIGNRGQKLLNLLIIVALPFLAYWMLQTLLPSEMGLTLQKIDFEQVNHYLSSLPINSVFLPTTWAVNFIFFWQSNNLFSLTNISTLISLLLILSLLTYLLTKKFYLMALDKEKAGQFIAGNEKTIKPAISLDRFPFIGKNIYTALIQKDILIFLRNRSEILQFGFIFFLIILYFLLLHRFPMQKIEQRLPQFSILSLIKLNFLISSYLVSVLAIRFIYPSISAETHSGWLIWSAPFNKAKLYWQKFKIGLIFLTPIIFVLNFVSAKILNLNFAFSVYQFMVLLLLAVCLNIISLSLGTIWPNFEEKNLEKLSTSGGGLLTTAVSLLYIFLFYKLFFSFSSLILLNFFLITLLTFCTIVLFSYLPLQKIEKYEF